MGLYLQFIAGFKKTSTSKYAAMSFKMTPLKKWKAVK